MNENRRAWAMAITVSLALHAAAIIFAPSFARAPSEEHIMTVSLAFQQKTKQAPVVKDMPKPEKQPVTPQPKQPAKNKVSKQAEQPQTEAKTEISKAPQDTTQAQSGENEQQSTGAAETSASAQEGAATGTNDAPSVVDVLALTVTKKVTPDYPSFSRKRKEEGTVTIVITIEGGRVTAAEIEQSSGHERLDASATRAVKQWRFAHTGKVKARVPFTFKLK